MKQPTKKTEPVFYKHNINTEHDDDDDDGWIEEKNAERKLLSRQM